MPEITSKTAKEMDEASSVEGLKKIEAALFLSGRFLNLDELAMLTDINPLMLKELLGKLVAEYNKGERGIEIVVKDNMWKMDVCKEYVSLINKLATGSSEFSKSEQETLAVIAYKQPVKQSVIVKIRGNKAYEHIKKFINNGLVLAKKMGHTKELKLSDDFFEYFHLRDKKLEENISDESIIDKEQSEKKKEPRGEEKEPREEEKEPSEKEQEVSSNDEREVESEGEQKKEEQNPKEEEVIGEQ